MDQISLWWIWTTMSRKFHKFSSKNMRLKLDAKDFACRTKAKAKPQRREPASSSPRTVPNGKRTWIDIEPGKHSLSAYEVSKKVIHLLRHTQQVHREEDGAVHLWRIKETLQNQFPQSIHWSDGRWKACLAAGGGAKRRFQYCTDDSGTIVYFRALQGHSGRNLVDPSLQDQCCYSEQLLPAYLPCWMCVQFAFYHQLWINTMEVKVRARDRHSSSLLILET